jgi:glycosyltransferase involved in cell wall biosynthesis
MSDASAQVDLSVVIPFHNESLNIRALFDRLLRVLRGLDGEWEVICVNDGSRDDTLACLIGMAGENPGVKVIDLSRNFGKEAALSAGLAYASGRTVVPMDGDLQHPPELIPALLAKWREGFDMVLAMRETREHQDWLGRLSSRAFYWLFRRLCEVPLPPEAGDFRLLDRRVVEALNRMPERNRFMKGIFAWVGFRQAAVPFVVESRGGGASKWGRLKLWRFALAGLTAFSNFPLRVWGLIGATISALAFVYIVFRLLRTLFFGIDVPGYETLLGAVLFMGGMQLLTLGIIGDYLGRVFDEVKGRPLYIVREAYGFGPDATSPGAQP